MMSTYLYELPTTGAISFQDFCVDQSASYSSQLAEATQARANLRAVLKESKRTDGEKDFLRVVKAIENYLPHLYGVKSCFEKDEFMLLAEPIFSWRSTLSASLFNSSPRQSVPSLHADLAFTLLTYGFAFSNLARSTVAALGRYEYDRTISETSRKMKDEKLNFAVQLLCRASGVFKYLSDSVLPAWDQCDTPSQVRPPDVTQEVTNALSKMAFADAQQLAIRKLMTKSAYDSTVSPGPPLPKSHPSPALIAKLHLECAELYSSARALAKTPGASRMKVKSKSRDNEEVSPSLRHYLSDSADFCGALARKWLGVDTGDNGAASQGGIAVAFLGWAKSELEELRGTNRVGANFDKDRREARGRLKEDVDRELETVTVYYKYYKKINDSLNFQPVPPSSELQTLIPSGRAAVSLTPFKPPDPAFGPGSAEYARLQMELLELNEGHENGEDKASQPERPSIEHAPSYAGKGSYY